LYCGQSDKMNHYNIIYQTVMKTYPQRTQQFHTAEAKEIYNRVKIANEQDRCVVFEREINSLREIATKSKAESMMFFVKLSQKKSVQKQSAENPEIPADQKHSAGSSSTVDDETNEKRDKANPEKKTNPPRAQMEAEKVVKTATQKVADLCNLRTADDHDVKQAIVARDMAKKY